MTTLNGGLVSNATFTNNDWTVEQTSAGSRMWARATAPIAATVNDKKHFQIVVPVLSSGGADGTCVGICTSAYTAGTAAGTYPGGGAQANASAGAYDDGFALLNGSSTNTGITFAGGHRLAVEVDRGNNFWRYKNLTTASAWSANLSISAMSGDLYPIVWAELGAGPAKAKFTADFRSTTGATSLFTAFDTGWLAPRVGATATATSGNLTLTEPTGAADGMLLVACITARSNAAFTLPAGWTIVGTQQSSGNTTVNTTGSIASGLMAYQVRSGAPNLTFTRTSGDLGFGRILAYEYIAGGTISLDTASANTLGAASTTVTSGTITTAVPGDLIVSAMLGALNATGSAFSAATDPATASGTTDAGINPVAGTWIERADSGTTSAADGSLVIGDAIRATAGATGTVQATASASARHAMVVGAFKIAADLTPTSLAIGSPAIGSPVLTTSHSLVANALAVSSPVIATPAMVQSQGFTTSTIVTSSPVLGTPAATQTHLPPAVAIALGSPVIDSPALSSAANLVATGVTTGSPVIATPDVVQIQALDASPLVTASPEIGSAALYQLENLSPVNLATGSPEIGSPSASSAHFLDTTGLTTVSPVIGAPVLGSSHNLVATDIAPGSPVIGTPDLTIDTGLWDLGNMITGSLEEWHDVQTSSVSIETGVALVGDKSGNGRDMTQPSTGNQPPYNATGINGFPVIEGLAFSNKGLLITSYYNDSLDETGANGSTGEMFFYHTLGDQVVALTADFTSPHVAMYWWDDTVWQVWLDGLLMDSGTLATAVGDTGAYLAVVQMNDAGAFGFGRIQVADMVLNRGDYGRGLGGYLGERARFSGDITAEIDKVFGYATWHWGLEANLPSGHPYETAPPTLSGADIMSPSNLTLGSPVIGQPALGSSHNLTATGLTLASPVIGQPAPYQGHIVTATTVVAGSPVIGPPGLSTISTFSTTDIVVASPVIDSPDATHLHFFDPVTVVTAGPVVGTPDLLGASYFDALVVIGSPVIGQPTVTSSHHLVASDVAAGSPVIGPGVLAQTQTLQSLPITIASPVIDSPGFLQTQTFSPVNILTGSPVIGQPLLTVRILLRNRTGGFIMKLIG